MINPISLEGKRILVTGASSGIGRACAKLASELGASVVATGRNQDRLEFLGCAVESVVGDITDASFVAGLVNVCGKLDGLVHAAGISLAVPLRMTDSAELRRVYETNTFAFFELMKVFANRRFARTGFSAVAVSSVAAMAGWSGVTAYAGSKGAVCATVRTLAIELAPLGFRVNSVCPSNIQTPMFEELAQGLNRQEVIDAIRSKQPLGIGTPEQVAAPVCFLLSDAASFITGVSLSVDGGYLAQ